ncbi:hypothetical protein [Alicycliphilus denitrificans]|uniref:hypothetical protein n=1 Tax=Alicycliphilus denitrificans TaxID=179636 RepID=UPI00384D74AD
MSSSISCAPALAALLAAALLAGCGTLDVPRADNYPATGQKKARAVHHWDLLADDVAARVAEKIAAWPAGEHPIHLTVADGSSFNQGFLKLLRVRLLDRGVALSTVPTGVELELQTQVVQHRASVPSNLPIPTPWTLLGTGVGVWRDWETHYSDRVLLPGVATAIGVGAGLAIDIAQRHTQGAAAGGPTRTEVLVTTILKTPDRYLAGSADMYYIERDDAVLYQPEPPLPAPTPLRTWKVVAP